MYYYMAQSQNLKDIVFIESEKTRLGTPPIILGGFVTDLLQNFKKRGFEEKSTSGKILTKIFEKNKEMMLGLPPFSKTQNILQVIAIQETLILAYGRIKP